MFVQIVDDGDAEDGGNDYGFAVDADDDGDDLY